VKAVKLAGGLLLLSNLVLVVWILMFRGDRLWRSARADEVDAAVVVSSAVGAVPA
jgi:hypothetical protein